MADLPDKAWYTIHEVAYHFDTVYHTVWRWIEIGKLEAVKLPGGIKISRKVLHEFINKSTIRPFD